MQSCDVYVAICNYSVSILAQVFEPIGCRCDSVCCHIAGEAMVSLGGVTRAMGVEPDDPSMLRRLPEFRRCAETMRAFGAVLEDPMMEQPDDPSMLRRLPDGGRCAETMRHFGSVLQDPIMERILQPPILLDMRQQLDRHWPMLDVLDGCKSHGRNPKTMEKDPVQVQRAAGVVWQWLSDDGGEFSAFFSCCLTVPFYSIPYYATFADNVHRCATGIKAMTMTKVEYQSLMVGWLCFGGRVVPLLADSTLDLSVADRDCRHPIIMNDKGDTDDADNEATEDEPLLVEVLFVGGIEIDSRTGLPWGMTQEEFDERNADYRLERQSRGAVHAHSMVWVDPSDSVQ